MSFINDYYYTIRRSNKEIFLFYCDNGLFYNVYDINNNLVKKINIFDKAVENFTYFNFCIDEDDNIYGILCFDNLKIIKCSKKNSDFLIDDIFRFDFQKFAISYPYIKKLKDKFHIFYYVYDLEEKNSSILSHIYKDNSTIKEQKIDFINHTMLDEYKIIYLDDNPVVIYFNTINEFEEIFISRFDISSKIWSEPFKLTNSQKNKFHIDAVYYKDFIHIAYCTRENDSCNVNYIKVSLKNNSFNISKSQIIAQNSVFMYPSLLTEDDRIYLMWINLNKLYTSYSIDTGENWYKEILDENSTNIQFTRSKFISNYKGDSEYNDKNLFSIIDEISFLGF